MEFYDVITARRSVRSYTADPIPEKSLEKIAMAVSLAPSACNLQPWSFRIVVNPKIRKSISDIYPRPWLAQAPAIAVALGNSETCWKRLEGEPAVAIDIGIAMEHLVLAAAAEGLGTCWICAYDVAKMNAALNILAPWSVFAITPLGYAAAESKPLQRKPIDEIFKIIR
jgi:nitroreductase